MGKKAAEPEAESSPPPAKRTLSPEQLERLGAARAKALEKRKLLGEISRREKAQREEAVKARAAKVGIGAVGAVGEPHAPPIAPNQDARDTAPPGKKKKKKAPPPPETSSSEEESEDSEESEESESSSEEEAPVKKKKSKSKKKPAKPTATKAPKATLTAEIARDELARRIERDNYAAAYSSLFPGQPLPF